MKCDQFIDKKEKKNMILLQISEETGEQSKFAYERSLECEYEMISVSVNILGNNSAN